MNLDQLQRLDGSLNRYLQDCYRNDFLTGAMTREDFDVRAQTIKALRREIKEKMAVVRDSAGLTIPEFTRLDRETRAARRRVQRIQSLVSPARRAMESRRLNSLDVESFDGGADAVTEIGVTTLESGVLRSFHAVIEEFLGVESQWTANRWKFAYGETAVIPARLIGQWLGDHLGDAPVMVGHDLKSDFRFLQSRIAISPAEIHDTAHMSRAIYGRALKLSRLCVDFGVLADVPHNAGNDARYTMEVLTAIIAREQELVAMPSAPAVAAA